ncbi:hypothetical protein VaNZ11_013044 [Volvox africanus]|uniref:Uncharacterized protein n=1 Tax=Volvox africanus TaxID=51714 RepID=A0ABQ5SG49_9CHLO|nr:hypothetical protein VaNZ11_013044 [Volvox africanus]
MQSFLWGPAGPSPVTAFSATTVRQRAPRFAPAPTSSGSDPNAKPAFSRNLPPSASPPTFSYISTWVRSSPNVPAATAPSPRFRSRTAPTTASRLPPLPFAAPPKLIAFSLGPPASASPNSIAAAADAAAPMSTPPA